MLSKNTIINLWHELEDTPFIERPDCEQILDTPDGFMGFPYGTTKGEIWDWFDKAYKPWGGLEALMDDPQPERKFQVKTPVGIIECYAKHEVDSDADYPGVFVDIRRTPDQLSGKAIGDLAACVEYDSGSGHLQTCVYQMFQDEPVAVEVYEPLMTYGQFMEKYGSEIVSLEVYNDDGEKIPDNLEIPDTAVVTYISRKSGSWEIEIQTTGPLKKKSESKESPIPERISIDMIRRGLTDGDIILCEEEGCVVAKIGAHWFYFGEEDGITASAHIDTTPFEEDVEMIHAAINAEPINGPTEDESPECLYYKAVLEERFRERDAQFVGRVEQYPIEDQIANCYRYLNWTDTHKNPYEMTEEELLEAEKELAECEPGIAWVAHAGYAQMVPQDKSNGRLILC